MALMHVVLSKETQKKIEIVYGTSFQTLCVYMCVCTGGGDEGVRGY